MPSSRGLAFDDVGEGPPVLMVHGAVFARSLSPLARERALTDRFRVVRYDRRGFGESAPLTSAPGPDAEAADAVALLDDLGIERAHVVAHSLGTIVAIRLAALAGDRMRSLSLIDPPLGPMWEMPAARIGLEPALARLEAGDTAGALDNMFPGYDWRTEWERVAPGSVEVVQRDVRRGLSELVDGLVGWSWGPETARPVTMPTLCLWGENTVWHADETAALFAEHVPQTEVTAIVGAGHDAPATHPAQVAELLAQFIERCE